ncbi:hypothetical protein HID58_005089 [Brassica napus]|uniref:Uncharacterized protein n=1 Tax=Brassica napus TaxID=3708 RepID=A0ABQ8E9Z7_BRANA|nr:hypothetical protein HID58_005089 [Brassica napus]
MNNSQTPVTLTNARTPRPETALCGGLHRRVLFTAISVVVATPCNTKKQVTSQVGGRRIA